MNADGHVLKAHYDKFRQINKYLELVAGCVDSLPKDRRIHIVDFGCGKSYLTFGLYYYLVPVSYTHLDVYKRQNHRHPGPVFQCRNPTAVKRWALPLRLYAQISPPFMIGSVRPSHTG